MFAMLQALDALLKTLVFTVFDVICFSSCLVA